MQLLTKMQLSIAMSESWSPYDFPLIPEVAVPGAKVRVTHRLKYRPRHGIIAKESKHAGRVAVLVFQGGRGFVTGYDASDLALDMSYPEEAARVARLIDPEDSSFPGVAILHGDGTTAWNIWGSALRGIPLPAGHAEFLRDLALEQVKRRRGVADACEGSERARFAP